MNGPEISVIIPVFNEEKNIATAIEGADACLKRAGATYEIIAVDDGSRDGSGQELGRAAAQNPAIRIITSAQNRGKGHAVKTGMLAAVGSYRLFFDADLAVPLETAEKFIRLLRDAKADIVIGTRKTKEAIITRRQPWYREFLGKGFSRLTNIMLGTSHTDITCGFKAFNAPAAAKIFGTQKIDGWGFDAEILFLARRFGLHVIEVPVTWRDDPDSKVHVMRDILKSLAELIRIRLLYL
jgi:dolichyl-phosphate beta-glucosyltransferase